MIETLQSEPVSFSGRPFGRVARSVAGYALLAALMFLSQLFVFVPAALLHCGIRNGRRAAAAALILGAAIAALLTLQTNQAPGVSLADARMAYAWLAAVVLAVGVPAVLALPLVERGESFGRVLMFALILGLAGLATTEIGMHELTGFSPYQDQVARFKQSSAEWIAAYQKAGVPPDAVRTLRHWLDIVVTTCLPALFLSYVILVFVFSLIMLSRLRAWRELAARRGDEGLAGVYLFRNFSLPDWLLFAFIVGGLTPLASGMLQKVAANVLAVVAFLYLLQGLAIFRAVLLAAGGGFTGGMLGYMVLAFLMITGIAQLPLSIAGLFDTFFDFRHFRRKDDSDESHTD